MKTGISTLIVKPGESEKTFPVISKYFKNIELTFNEKLNYEDKFQLEKLKKNILKNKFKIISFHMPTRRPVSFSKEVIPVDIASRDEWIRKWSIREIEKTIAIIKNIISSTEKKYLILHCGKKEDESGIERSFESLKEINDFSSGFNIEVLVENVLDSSVGSEIDEIIYIAKELKTGICFDIGHSFISGNVYDDLEKAFNFVKSIHIHDNKGKIDEHLAPYEGKIDFEKFISILKKKNYDGNLIFEIYPYKDVSEILNNLKKFEKYLFDSLN